MCPKSAIFSLPVEPLSLYILLSRWQTWNQIHETTNPVGYITYIHTNDDYTDRSPKQRNTFIHPPSSPPERSDRPDELFRFPICWVCCTSYVSFISVTHGYKESMQAYSLLKSNKGRATKGQGRVQRICNTNDASTAFSFRRWFQIRGVCMHCIEALQRNVSAHEGTSSRRVIQVTACSRMVDMDIWGGMDLMEGTLASQELHFSAKTEKVKQEIGNRMMSLNQYQKTSLLEEGQQIQLALNNKRWTST